MKENDYEWIRYWCPNNLNIYTTSEGYLKDPQSNFSQNSHLVANPIEDSKKCILLLGDVGIGKSFYLERSQQNLEKKFRNSDGIVVHVDLKSVGSEYALKEKVFENQKLVEWINGDDDNRLYLLLDSIDEAFLRIRVLEDFMLEELRKISHKQLYLRIACRSGYWPINLTEGLQKIFGREEFGLYTMAPLQKKDILEAARKKINKEMSKSSEHFIEEVENLEMVAFAVRPLLLKQLISSYTNEGTFPKKKEELYRRYCNYLCKELDKNRYSLRDIISSSTEERYIMACRIAAVCILSQNYGIWTGKYEEEMNEGLVSQTTLKRGKEKALGNEFPINNDILAETLACGLFTSSDPRRELAHRDFMEFLAAEYLIKKHIPLIQIKSLIEHPLDPEKKIIPYLRGLVAWLCSMNREIFNSILKSEPDILIQSDIISLDPKLKEVIVKTILENYDESSIWIKEFEIESKLGKLFYPNLGEEIINFVSNKENSKEARGFALKIAESCNLIDLKDFLIDIILDETDENFIRDQAAWTLEELESSNQLKDLEKLKAIALTDVSITESYNLKGLCLNILWPEHIKINEILEHLVPPIKGYRNKYYKFLYESFTPNLTLSDIIPLMKWVSENFELFKNSQFNPELIDQILHKSLEFSAFEKVLDELSELLVKMVQDINFFYKAQVYRNRFQKSLENNNFLRRNLLGLVLQKLPNEKKYLYNISDFGLLGDNQIQYNGRIFDLLNKNDIEWLLDQYRVSNDEIYKEKVQYLIGRVLFLYREDLDKLYKLYQKYPDLKESIFIYWFGPIELESNLAESLKREYEERLNMEQNLMEIRKSHQFPDLEPSPQESIKMCLTAIEEENYLEWINLNLKLTLTQNSSRYGYPYNPDLQSLPGWTNSDNHIQERIVNAAEFFVLEIDSDYENWIGTNRYSANDYAAYRALRLLFEKNREFIENLNSEIWEKWIPIVLLYKIQVFDSQISKQENKIREELLAIGYPLAREKLIETIREQIIYENREYNRIYFLSIIKSIWDNAIAEELHNVLINEELVLKSKEELMKNLLQHNFSETEEYLSNLISELATNENTQLQLKAAKSLILYTSESYWKSV